MKLSIKSELFISSLFVGIMCSFGYIFFILPLFEGILYHCLLSGLMFAFINYFVTIRIYKKYLAEKETNKILSVDINIDKLTGLLNRRAFDKDIDEIDDKAGYSFVFIDIDNFRNFNNKFGHQAGDTVLKSVSQTIKQHVRHSDKVYRYGGEEIVVLLRECNKTDALKIAESIRISVSNLNNSPYPNISLSLGVSNYPADGNTINEAIRISDEALLTAKKNGKNRTFSI